MQRFPRVPAPDGWASEGLAAGIAWLARSPQNPSKPRPRDYWSPYRDQLARGFGDLCGYTLMYVANGTVDHLVPWSTLRGTAQAWRAYDWDNFRYCDSWFNAARRGPVPDPFLVDEAWFELRLPSLELVATADVPKPDRPAVDNALRLLRDDPRVIKPRREWFRMYREEQLTFAELTRKAPLIAAALRRQPEFLLPADQARMQAGAL